MRVLSIGYILREAWRGLTRARISSFAAIGIIAFMLVLLGIVGYIFNLVNCTFAGVSNQLEIIVYLNDNLKAEERKSLKDNITSIEGVKEVVYIPKNEAWKRFKETFKGNKLVLEIIGENPLPDSFEIKLIDGNYINYVSEALRDMPGIKDIDVPLDIANRLNSLIKWVEIGGTLVILVFIGVSLFIISNVIRLSFVSRIRELEIMQLVGATGIFIRGPFILEGVLCGFFGGIIGAMVFNALVYLFNRYILSSFPLFSTATNFNPFTSSLGLVLFGMMVGGIGSAIFLERHLKR